MASSAPRAADTTGRWVAEAVVEDGHVVLQGTGSGQRQWAGAAGGVRDELVPGVGGYVGSADGVWPVGEQVPEGGRDSVVGGVGREVGVGVAEVAVAVQDAEGLEGGRQDQRGAPAMAGPGGRCAARRASPCPGRGAGPGAARARVLIRRPRPAGNWRPRQRNGVGSGWRRPTADGSFRGGRAGR